MATRDLPPEQLPVQSLPAYRLAVSIARRAPDIPVPSGFSGLHRQLVRAANSVLSGVAEGWTMGALGQHHLVEAMGSLAEVAGYLDTLDYHALDKQVLDLYANLKVLRLDDSRRPNPRKASRPPRRAAKGRRKATGMPTTTAGDAPSKAAAKAPTSKAGSAATVKPRGRNATASAKEATSSTAELPAPPKRSTPKRRKLGGKR